MLLALCVLPAVVRLFRLWETGENFIIDGWLLLSSPFVFAAGVFLVRKLFPIPCPHCRAHLGVIKKKFFDVAKTGVCWKCRAVVVEDSP